ncbi:MAG TPA: hypothetical protein VH187_07975 [Scandinavium sp.]|uniref:hypothetical protein n=1 Tax=Scandinavium sp. TaxID=2830653 RepID=UPI002E2F9634|nr:hypothetical protein [Scandinavium sp.]HEX4501082.1 hypothetical protein [Scandinavium sp.]
MDNSLRRGTEEWFELRHEADDYREKWDALENVSHHICDFYEQGLIDWLTMDESMQALTLLQESL